MRPGLQIWTESTAPFMIQPPKSQGWSRLAPHFASCRGSISVVNSVSEGGPAVWKL